MLGRGGTNTSDVPVIMVQLWLRTVQDLAVQLRTERFTGILIQVLLCDGGALDICVFDIGVRVLRCVQPAGAERARDGSETPTHKLTPNNVGHAE